ncbi:MAG: zinc-dependent metalloprotease [Bacteriovoracaceae bacterium]
MKTKLKFLFLALALILSSCSVEREESFDESVDTSGLLTIAQFKSGNCSVQAIEAIIEPQGVTKATSLNNKESFFLSNHPIVSYETDCPLFDNMPFRGLPGYTYQISYQLEQSKENHNHYFISFSKISTKKTMSHHETNLVSSVLKGEDKTENTEDDLYVIPLFKYRVNLLMKEYRKDPNSRENTHITFLKEVHSLSDATFFRIASTRFLAKPHIRQDTFPVSFFEGPWFYSRTIVSASVDEEHTVGRVLNDFTYENKSRVKFEQVDNGFTIVGTSIDPSINPNKLENLQEALFLPARWVDYRIKDRGDEAGLVEEELDDNHADSRNYRKRDYVSIDFPGVKTSMKDLVSTSQRSDYSRDFTNTKAYFENLEITKNYLSFTIYYPEFKKKVKFAFKRAPQKAKKPRVYHYDDMKKFGYFYSEKNVIKSAEYHRKEDFNRLNMIQRFYPSNNIIEYRLSKQTPRKYYDVAEKAVAAWQEAFDKAFEGAPESEKIQIVLSADRTNSNFPKYDLASIGDIRYNIINIIDSKAGRSLLGYGPSIVDSESGEIISATSNVYVNPVRNKLISIMRNYVRSKLGVLKKFQLNGFESQSISSDHISSVQSISSNNHSSSSKISQTASVTKLPRKDRKFNLRTSLQQRHEYFENTYKFSVEKIESRCEPNLIAYFSDLFEQNVTSLEGEEFSTLLEEHKEQAKFKTHLDNDELYFSSCVEDLIKDDLLSTLIHELGHNFGLSHNFMASSAKEKNAFNLKGEKIYTSSVMDYIPLRLGTGLSVGSYDIAAIRYGYRGMIETNNGELLKVPTSQSIKDFVKTEQIKDMRQFKFCSDDQIYKSDPLCAAHDFGSTPKDVVSNIIQNFFTFQSLQNYRYDRFHELVLDKETYMDALATEFFVPLKMFYEKWRFYLNRLVSSDNRYLDFAETSDHRTFNSVIQDKIDQIENKENRELYQNYFETAQTIRSFLNSIIMEPALTCLAIDRETNELTPFEFHSLREKIYQKMFQTVYDCQDPLVADYFELENYNVHPKVSFGTLYEDINESLDPEEEQSFKELYAYGFLNARSIAIGTLIERTPYLELLARQGFQPNFLDNPINRNELNNFFITRIQEGIQFEYEGKSDFFPFFLREKGYLSDATREFIKSLMIPGKDLQNELVKHKYIPQIVTESSEFLASQNYNAFVSNNPSFEGIPFRDALTHHAPEEMLSSVGILYRELSHNVGFVAKEDEYIQAYALLETFISSEKKIKILSTPDDYVGIQEFQTNIIANQDFQHSADDVMEMSYDEFQILMDNINKELRFYGQGVKTIARYYLQDYFLVSDIFDYLMSRNIEVSMDMKIRDLLFNEFDSQINAALDEKNSNLRVSKIKELPFTKESPYLDGVNSDLEILEDYLKDLPYANDFTSQVDIIFSIFNETFI